MIRGNSDERPFSLRQARKYTRRLALAHYENFIVGGILTPRRVRQDFYNLYAYCRMADDLADEIQDDVESLSRLNQWGEWLEECHAGRPPRHPVFVALRPTIERFNIPREPFFDLLDAFRQDQQVKHYDRFDDVVDYCRRSANPVGHMVLHLGECFTPEREFLSDQICTGLQLANFCQDIRRDAALGRVYIPQEDLVRFNIEPRMLELATPPSGGPAMLKFEVDRAESFLRRGLPLADDVPPWLGRQVRLFAGGGLAILDQIRRAAYDVWTARPKIGPTARAKLVWRTVRE